MKKSLPILSIWLILLLCSAFFILFRATQGPLLSADLRALLPSQATSEHSVSDITAMFERELVVQVQPAGEANAVAAFISASKLIQEIRAPDLRSLLPVLKRFQFKLLTAEDQNLLTANNQVTLNQVAYAELMGGGALVRPFEVSEDPYGTLSRYLQLVLANLGVGDRDQATLLATLRIDPFDLEAQAQFASFTTALMSAFPHAGITLEGVITHATVAATQAKKEVTLIGGLSIAMVIALLLISFRSLVPLVYLLTIIAASYLNALAAVLLLFPTLHLITLIFGATLVGVCVDYGFHYLNQTPGANLQKLFAALLLAALTSAAAYAALAIPAFPGLRQMAVVGVVGLLTALASVYALQGWVRLRKCHMAIPDWHYPKIRPVIVLGALVASGYLFGFASFNDDVRSFTSNTLLQEQAQADPAAANPNNFERGIFLLVTGASTEEVLQREESAITQLTSAQAVDGYIATSLFVPSVFRQARNQAAFAAADYPTNADQFLRRVGFPESVITTAVNAYQSQTAEFMQVDTITDLTHGLWWQEAEGHIRSTIRLRGIRDYAALSEIAAGIAGVDLINPVAEINAIMLTYRQKVSLSLLAALLVSFVVLFFRRGWQQAWLTSQPVVCSLPISLGLVALVSGSLNLFHLLAAFMVLGLGLDFAIIQSSSRSFSALQAITLAMLTTLASFGVLTMSQTPAVASFGITVLIGTSLAWIFTWLSISRKMA